MLNIEEKIIFILLSTCLFKLLKLWVVAKLAKPSLLVRVIEGSNPSNPKILIV